MFGFLSSWQGTSFPLNCPLHLPAGKFRLCALSCESTFSSWGKDKPAGYSYKEDFMWIFSLATKALCPALSLGIVSCMTLIHDFACDNNAGFLLTFPFPPSETLTLCWCGCGLMPRSYLWYHILSIMTCLPDGSGDTGIDKSNSIRNRQLLWSSWGTRESKHLMLEQSCCGSSAVVLNCG